MTNRELQLKLEQINKRIDKLESWNGFKKDLYSIQEIADIFGVTREAIYYKIKRGEIPTIKFGTMKVRAVDIENILGKKA